MSRYVGLVDRYGRPLHQGTPHVLLSPTVRIVQRIRASRRLESASSQGLYRTGISGHPSPFSACMYLKVVSLPAVFGVALQCHTADGAGAQLRVTSAGVFQLHTEALAETVNGDTLSTDTWYHIGIAAPTSTGGSGDTWASFLAGVAGPTNTDYVVATTNTVDDIRIGFNTSGNQPLDCLVGYARFWDGVTMNATQMSAERDSATAVYAPGLFYDSDFISAITGWTENGTTSDSDDEPLFAGGNTGSDLRTQPRGIGRGIGRGLV